MWRFGTGGEDVQEGSWVEEDPDGAAADTQAQNLNTEETKSTFFIKPHQINVR